MYSNKLLLTFGLSSVLFFGFVQLARIPGSDVFEGSVSTKLKSSPLAKVNIDAYLKNRRAMQLQIKCIVYGGPCDLVGKEVKKFIFVGLTGNCPDCDPRLREKIHKIVDYIIENYPNVWKDAIYNYLIAPTLGMEEKSAKNNTELTKNPTVELQQQDEVQLPTELPTETQENSTFFSLNPTEIPSIPILVLGNETKIEIPSSNSTTPLPLVNLDSETTSTIIVSNHNSTTNDQIS